ncbi:hypothetical protein [Alcaligenes sp. SDU_A2]|uniref:hypothetical protein n=1 Tax=Alcaligenes sp. SDU_A2 TaxID=3136634 RepID=UPI00311E5DC8
MDIVVVLLMAALVWNVLRVRYQRGRIALLGRHLGSFQLERHMETLTEGYTRAIREQEPSRQLQVLDMFAQTERAVAAQTQSLADQLQNEAPEATRVSMLPFCLPYIERILPSATRDFRTLLQIHAAGLRHVVDNNEGLDPRSRAYHLSAELYLLQHSCHWFCKSRTVADARLQVRHKVTQQKVLESVSEVTRSAYLRWQHDA